MLAESNHEELAATREKLEAKTAQVGREREAAQTMHARIAELETQLVDEQAHKAQGNFSADQRMAEMRAEIVAKQDEAVAADWVAREERQRVIEELQANTVLLKEGLARKVMMQIAKGCLTRCWKAWSIYTIKRRLQRSVNPDGLSEDEDEAARKLPQEGIQALFRTVQEYF